MARRRFKYPRPSENGAVAVLDLWLPSAPGFAAIDVAAGPKHHCRLGVWRSDIGFELRLRLARSIFGAQTVSLVRQKWMGLHLAWQQELEALEKTLDA